jgi:hypothetical protein
LTFLDKIEKMNNIASKEESIKSNIDNLILEEEKHAGLRI